MSEKVNPVTVPFVSTRRQMIGGVGVAIGFFAASPHVWGKTPQSQTKSQSGETDKSRTFLHQEIEIQASSQRIYDALLDSKQFAAFTGLPAEIDAKAGGAFYVWRADRGAEYRTDPTPANRPGVASIQLGSRCLFDRQV